MSTTILVDEDFDQTIADNKIVFIDFWADWCQPCKAFEEVFTKIAQENPDILFAKVDVEDQPTLAQDFNIRSVPFLVVLKEQVAVYAKAGNLPQTALEELVEQARAVDVSQLSATDDTDNN